jgi:hypothetical protein
MIKPQVKYASILWTEVGLDILEEFESKKWNISFQDVTDAFNEAFWYHDIRFFLAEDSIEDGFRKYIECGMFYYDDGLIEIYLRDDFLPFLQRLRSKKDYIVRWMNFGKNRFLEEYLEVVSHELLHRKQWELGMKKTAHSNSIELDTKHFSDYAEIQAHAQDTALYILMNRSSADQFYFIWYYSEFFGHSSPIYKAFMKNYQRFLEMMREDQIHLLF